MKPYESMVEAQYLRVCTPQMAYDWLATKPREGFNRRVGRFTVDDTEDRETVLLGREDPLIDFGLARFGTSHRVAESLYARLDAETRKVMRACHKSAGGPSRPFIDGDPNDPALLEEMGCWVTNPDLGDDLLTELFTRTGVFSRLDDGNYLRVVSTAASNERLRAEYASEYFDGYDDYSYHKPIKAAWDLVLTAPLTPDWASALWSLLDNTISTGASFDVEKAIQRWRIDEKPENPNAWYDHSTSFYLRVIIARHRTRDDTRLKSDDMAVRCAFYRDFSPHSHPNWPSFLDRDGEVFFQYALDNPDLWSRQATREQLWRVAWDVLDPRHNMEAQNLYRSVEKRWRSRYPGWFIDEASPAEETRPEEPKPVPVKEKRLFRF